MNHSTWRTRRARSLRARQWSSTADGTPKIPGASTFADMESAQRYTQYALRDNTDEINKWLSGNPPKPMEEFNTTSVPLQGPLAGDAVTGRGTSLVDGKVTEVQNTKGVSLRLMYDPSLDPPYVVFSSMPK